MSNDDSRNCGECTACCQGWLKAEIHGELMYPGKNCQHCSKQGCTNYEARPERCKDFKCSWLANEKIMPDWMRPDKAKVIAYQVNLLGDGQPQIITAIPVGKTVPPRSLNVLKDISLATKLPLIYVKRFKDKKGAYTEQKEFHGFGANDTQHLLNQVKGLLENALRMGT